MKCKTILFLVFKSRESKYENYRQSRQFPYFDYMETTYIVSSFRILIINCKMHFFCVFKSRESTYGNNRHCRQFLYLDYQLQNPLFSTCFRVGSFRILIIKCKKRFFWCLSAENPHKKTADHCRQFLYLDYHLQNPLFFSCFIAYNPNT